jgi:hypothetical protein
MQNCELVSSTPSAPYNVTPSLTRNDSAEKPITLIFLEDYDEEFDSVFITMEL